MICPECHINEVVYELTLPIVLTDENGEHTNVMADVDIKLCQNCYDQLHAGA